MKIIDVNVRLGARNSRGEIVTAETLTAVMKRFHIAHAVASHEMALLDPLYGNLKMKQAAEHSDGSIGVCAVLDPILNENCIPGAGSLTERLKSFAPEALRICPENNRTVFHPLYWQEILEAAEELALPLLLDFDYPPEFFLMLPEVSAQYANVKFVMLRYGLCRARHILPLLKSRKNIWFTVEKMLDYMQIEELYAQMCCDRLLFASDYPQTEPSGVMGLITLADIPAQAKAQILHGNWEAMRV